MKKILVMFTVMFLIPCCAALAEATFTGTEMSIALPSSWQDCTARYPNTSIALMSPEGVLVSITTSDMLEGATDPERIAAYETLLASMTDEQKYDMLQGWIKLSVGSKFDIPEIENIKMAGDINASYCSFIVDGRPCAYASLLAKREMWNLVYIDSRPGTASEGRDALLSLMQAISLRDFSEAADSTP